jgi:hypothetical protein
MFVNGLGQNHEQSTYRGPSIDTKFQLICISAIRAD